MDRRVLALALTAPLAAACSSGSGSAGPTPSASAGSTAPCTVAGAVTGRQTLIAASFDPSCVKIKARTQFFFVNNAAKKHTATTQAGDPESFDAILPQKTSTYAHTFKKKGTYVIVDKTTGAKMTLFVQ